jgi:hypothetical protein
MMRLILRPALTASSRQRCSRLRRASGLGSSVFSGSRATPGTIAPTSYLLLRTPEGCPIPPNTMAELQREMAHFPPHQ